MSSAYCSPEGSANFRKDHTCFDKNALVRLVEAWNTTHPSSKIHSYKSMTKHRIIKTLSERMSDVCPANSKGRDACWVDNLEGKNPSRDIAKNLRPLKPDEWNDNEYTWLTNLDIEAVMKQYDFDVSRKYKYKFIGVFPIDFQARTMFGQCLFTEFCNLNIVAMWKRGIRFIGMITNLDKHHQSGSHWTSFFACIDPKLPCFGAYYYDSVASTPPPEIVKFVDTLKQQVKSIPGADNKTFTVKYNKMRHQRGNTECGVFSIDYQIRWIEGLLKNPATKFENVAHIPKIDDAYIHKFRDVYFRPFRKNAKGA